jgi:hypothetical protein
MPLPQFLRSQILEYCTNDLPGDMEWHAEQFDFILDPELKRRLGRAFYSARYVAKLMEATLASGDQKHPFVKFQIIQYASIYEAVITYLLWGPYKEHPEVRGIETHKAYRKVPALSSSTTMTWHSEQFGDEELFACVYRATRTRKNSIPFPDRLDCAVRIGLVNEANGGDIKAIYQLRNLTHIETEAERNIEVEIEHSRLGYWRLKPFLEVVKNFLEEDDRAWCPVDESAQEPIE